VRWRPPGLDGLRVARDMVSFQTFWSLGRGARHAGQNFTPGLMSRLSLRVGHLTFMSLILLSLPMGGGPSREIIQYQSTELGKGDRKEKRRAVDRQGLEFQGNARADVGIPGLS